MIKLLTIASLCCGLGGAAFAQTYAPAYPPPQVPYTLPPVDIEAYQLPPSLLYEGRSARISEPAAFFNGTDNMGYPTGVAQSPQND